MIARFVSLALVIIFTSFFSIHAIIVRHDADEREFINLAKAFPQLCHLPMGEAVLIHPSWVLTAGHVGKDLRRDIAEGFQPTVRCAGKEYSIQNVFIHPGFRDMGEGLQNDIALVKLTGAVTDVEPSAICRRKDESGKVITIAGSGDSGTGLTGPDRKDRITRAATNRIDSITADWLIFTFDAVSTEGVTALEGISGPGDSGGPGFINIDGQYVVAGISSHQLGDGEGKGKYGSMEFYTRVSTYAGWIDRMISEN